MVDEVVERLKASDLILWEVHTFRSILHSTDVSWSGYTNPLRDMKTGECHQADPSISNL